MSFLTEILPDDTYPEGPVNHRVQQQLKAMAERFKGFYAEEEKEKS